MNKIAFVIIILICSVFIFFSGCRNSTKSVHFPNLPINRMFKCDTIINKNIKGESRVINVYEVLDTSQVKYQNFIYNKYNLSITNNGKFCLIRADSIGVWLLPNPFKSKPINTNDQSLLKFNAKKGDVWEINWIPGILSNTHLMLDSVRVTQNDKIYYMSANQIYKLTDQVRLIKIVISKINGISELKLLDEEGYNDIIRCKCDN